MTSISASKMTNQQGPFRPRSAVQKNSPETSHGDNTWISEGVVDDNFVPDRNARVVTAYHAALQGLLRRGFL